MPSQVFVSVTPALRSFLRDCRVTSARKSADDESVDMDEVYRLASEHEKLGGEQVKVHELLEGAEVLDRIPAEAPPMTELEEMRLKSEERKYQRSVQGVAPLYGRKKNEGFDVAGFSFATNFGTQVIVAFIGAFLLGYFFVETFVSQDNNVLKVIAGVACSFCTLLLETCLLMVHESKETMIENKRTQSDIREGQRKKKLAALKHAKKGAQAVSETAADGPEARGGEEEVDDKQGKEQPKKGQHDKKED
mmetsp:Transcript_91562/g.262249  ORF Transcript_91562/g.262249 Transcript_91562/m.262249 type:complete len:249 (-) Transcript_91562:77-823(-)